MNTAPGTQLRSFSIEGPSEFIERLQKLDAPGLKSGIPLPSTSPVDLLDAPMNKNKFATALQIITLLISTSTAAVKLAEEVEHFLKENPGLTITVRDALDGKVLGKFDHTTPRVSIDDRVKL